MYDGRHLKWNRNTMIALSVFLYNACNMCVQTCTLYSVNHVVRLR